MSSPNEIRKGTVLNIGGELNLVIDFQRVSPGKGSSFVRTRVKNLKSGKVVDTTFKSAESVEFADVQNKKMQYLFSDGDTYTFMDVVSFDQVTINKEDIGDNVKYLKESLEVTVVMYNDQALTIDLPRKINYTVTSTQPAVKGDTASGNVQKDATMENGLLVRVPIFLKEGDEISVNTENGEYVERVNQ